MNCDRVLTYPQFTGTCWFNSIIAVLFFSQGMRRLVEKEMTTKPDTPLFRSLRELCVVYNDRGEYLKMLDKIKKPEELIKILFDEYPLTIRFNPFTTKIEKLVDLLNFKYYMKWKTHTGYWPDVYFPRILRVLFPRQNFIFLQAYHHLREDGTYRCYYRNDSRFNLWSIDRKLRDKVIDILIIQIYEPDAPMCRSGARYDRRKKIPGLKFFGNIQLDPKITIKEKEYRLDSATLVNYDYSRRAGGFSHAIAGITCGGKEYVYSGWDLDENKTVCRLQPHLWKRESDSKDFSLASRTCKLAPPMTNKDINPSRYHNFNFHRGARQFIYVSTDYYPGTPPVMEVQPQPHVNQTEKQTITNENPNKTSTGHRRRKKKVEKREKNPATVNRPLDEVCREWNNSDRTRNPLSGENYRARRLRADGPTARQIDLLCRDPVAYCAKEKKNKIWSTACEK